MRQFLSTCSDDSKPYMILEVLVNTFLNDLGFAIFEATGQGWQAHGTVTIRCVLEYTCVLKGLINRTCVHHKKFIL